MWLLSEQIDKTFAQNKIHCGEVPLCWSWNQDFLAYLLGGQLSHSLHLPLHPKPMSPTPVKCSLSKRRRWHSIAD